MLLALVTLAFASSHREAPAIALDPSADITDFYAFISPEDTSKVVFITTSVFTGEAREYVKSIGKTIILIDGTTLARLMTEYGVGVSETARYVVRRIDSDYFEAG